MRINPNFVVIPILALILTRAASAADGSTFVELPSGYVVGGHAAGKWLTSEQAGKAIKPRTDFRLFSLKGAAGKMSIGKAAPDAEVCPDVWIAQINRETDVSAIAIAATWNPMPRPVTSAATTQEAYVKAVSDVLTGKGIKKPVVKIAQHLRADLDGDGEEEVLLSATHYPDEDGGMGAPMAAVLGNYSFVALRRVVGGKVVTQILNGEFYPKTKESNAPNIHKVGGLLDLDGDGKMEIILDSTYYEGGGTTVWQLDARKAVKVLEIECGV